MPFVVYEPRQQSSPACTALSDEASWVHVDMPGTPSIVPFSSPSYSTQCSNDPFRTQGQCPLEPSWNRQADEFEASWNFPDAQSQPAHVPLANPCFGMQPLSAVVPIEGETAGKAADFWNRRSSTNALELCGTQPLPTPQFCSSVQSPLDPSANQISTNMLSAWENPTCTASPAATKPWQPDRIAQGLEISQASTSGLPADENMEALTGINPADQDTFLADFDETQFFNELTSLLGL
ncbi:hypothetical protein WJX74_006009 [Apatococcus lobatus]|uniref:Uncharacterized protein n=1 Tax=Apatococcus lobatus TaxID=904363 RepID=A0AAW1Q7Q9_9CHLO